VNLNDLVCQAILVIFVPPMVSYYLKGPSFSGNMRALVTIGGILWVFYAIFSEPISERLLGVSLMDSRWHDAQAKSIAEHLSNGNWDIVWDYWHTGNPAYDLSVALLYYFTGTGISFVTALNGWLAFLGGLVLARHFGTLFKGVRIRNAGFLFIIFFPSVIFWTTSNLKEGLMYLAICLVIGGTLSRRQGMVKISVGAIIGTAVGLVLRPHVIICWIGAIAAVYLFRGGRRIYALGLLALMPFMLNLTAAHVQMELTAESALKVAEDRFTALEGGGSAITYEGGKPILLISGLISIFFRPFPWDVSSLRTGINAFETWVTTGIILLGIYKLTRDERRYLLRFSEIDVAIVALLALALFLTFLPNVGLMVRQRVQALPALLILAVTPFLVKAWFRNLRVARGLLALGFPRRENGARLPLGSGATRKDSPTIS
jgi:hypothetical protein